MPKLLYTYMVVYAHQTGTGRIEITTPTRIRRYSDIEAVDKKIVEHNGLKAMVVSYKLLKVTIKWR